MQVIPNQIRLKILEEKSSNILRGVTSASLIIRSKNPADPHYFKEITIDGLTLI